MLSLFSRTAATFALALAALTPNVFAGSIVLNDGKTLEGTVSLVGGENGGIMLQAAGKPSETFKFSEVQTAVFDGLAGGDGAVAVGGGGVPWVRTEVGENRRASLSQLAGDKIIISDPPEQAVKKDPGHAISTGFCYVFQKLDWDGEILAHVTTGEAPGWSFGGLMICEGLDGLGPMAIVARTSEPGLVSFVRREARDEEVTTISSAKNSGATWLKLTRSWDRVRAMESVDGATWNSLGEFRIEMDDKKGVFVGVVARGNAKGGVVFDSVKLSGRRSPAVVPGEADPRLRDMSVILRDGTILAGILESVTAAGDGKVKIAERGPEGDRITLKAGVIARAQFAQMSASQLETFLAANTGALTKDGDFVEGDLKDIKNGSVTVSSITFGLTTLQPGRALGVVFQQQAPRVEGQMEVRLQDGSLIVAEKLSVEKDQLVIEEPLIGPVKFGLKEVISIGRQPAKQGL